MVFMNLITGGASINECQKFHFHINSRYLLLFIYKTSVLNFTLVGLFRRRWLVPMIIQSFISYKSDIQTLGKKSRWHTIDRLYASIISMIHMGTLKRNYKLQMLLFVVSYYFLNKSQKLYTESNTKFLLYHIFWHTSVPLMVILR